MSSCPHFSRLATTSGASSALLKRFEKISTRLRKHPMELVCKSCEVSLPNVWICMFPDCEFLGCGRNQNKHAMKHSDSHKNHNVYMNVKTREAWCYECDGQIVPLTTLGTEGVKGDADNQQQADPADELFDKLTQTLAPPMPKREDDDDSADPATPSASSSERKPKYTPGLCGLDNLGNTCYMNSALQCLNNSPPLVDYFLQCEPLYAMKNQRVIDDFARFFRAMWSGQATRITPRNVAYDVFAMNPQFNGYGQQDSQECLRTILDNLHERLKDEDFEAEKRYEEEESARQQQAAQASQSSSAAETSSDKAPKKAPPKRRFYKSIISSVFEGSLLSRVQCSTCGNTSDTFDAFYDLSVSIPSDSKQMDKIRKRQQALSGSGLLPPGSGLAATSSKRGGLFSSFFGLGSFFSKRTVDLYECLHGFCSTDDLTWRDKYRCEKCKDLSDATKAFTINKPPEVLCIQIKRFRYDTYFGSKISDHVTFPLEGLDLTPFCVTETAQADDDDKFDTPDRRKQLKQNPHLYDLCGIVNHMGSLGGGHYIAYCRNKETDKWYCFDDSRVSEVSADEVRNAEAYLLFYVKRPTDQRLKELEKIETMIAKGQAKPSDTDVKVSKLWLQTWRTTENPGPISSLGLVCKHGLLKREAADHLEKLTERIPKKAYDILAAAYGVEGADLMSLQPCQSCMDPERLRRRRTFEIKRVQALDRTTIPPGEPWFMLHRGWLDAWLQFAHRNTREEPPGPISNQELFEDDGVTIKKGLVKKVDYRGVCREVWEFFHEIYGGGPVIARAELDLYSRATDYAEKKAAPQAQIDCDAMDVDK